MKDKRRNKITLFVLSVIIIGTFLVLKNNKPQTPVSSQSSVSGIVPNSPNIIQESILLAVPEMKKLLPSPPTDEFFKLVAAVKKDEPCKLFGTSTMSVPDNFYLAAAELVPQFEKISAVGKAWIYISQGKIDETLLVLKNDNSVYSQMFQAMMHGGYLRTEGIKVDYQESKKRFELLSAEDPSNGSYLYFLVDLYHKLNYPELEIQEAILKLSQAKYFDLKMREVWNNAYTIYGATPSGLVLISMMTTAISVPNVLEPIHNLKLHLKKSQELNETVLSFARMVRMQEVSKKNGLEFLDYFILLHAASQSLGQHTYKNLNPGKPIPEEWKKNFAQVFAHSPQKKLLDKFYNSLVNYQNRTDCDRLTAEMAYDELKTIRGW